MRRKAIVAILFLISYILLIPLSPSVDAEKGSTKPHVELSRLIEVRDWGLVVMNDTVSIINNGSEPILFFQVGLPSNFSQSLKYVCASTEHGERLSTTRGVDMDLAGIEGIKIALLKAIDVGEKFNFTITYVFSDMVTPSTRGYNVTFPEYPVLAFDAVSCNITVVLPSDSSLLDSSWEEGGVPTLSHAEQPLPAYSNETGFVYFSGSMKVLECEYAKREVVFDPSGQIFFYDSLRLHNLGMNTISTMSFTLPRGAHDIVAYDYFGELETTSSESEDTGVPEVTVKLRHPALRGRPYFDACSFTLKYVVPAKNCVKQTGLWDYVFETERFSSFDWIIRELTFKIALPEGGEFSDLYGAQGNVTREGYRSVLTLRMEDVIPFRDLGVKVAYRYIIFWSAFRPTIWIGILISILCAITAFHRARGISIEPIPPKTLGLMRDLIDVCDERVALRSELEALEDAYHRGRIRKKDYKRRTKIIERQRFLLDRQFVELRRELRRAEPRFVDALRRMEVAETEIETAKAGIRELKARYRRGEISREAFERLMEDYEKRIDKAKTTIDDVIMEFKEEAR